MRAEQGHVFRFEGHITRIKRSAEALLSSIDDGVLPTKETCEKLMERNALRDARLRLTVTAGSMRLSEATGEPNWTVCVTASPLGAYPSDFYEKGVATVVCDHKVSPSDPLAGHKTTNYLGRLMGLRQAQRAGCVEAIWFTTSHLVAEGSISNMFLVHNGTLKTPPLDTPVLPGIARGVVLEIAKREGIETSECTLTINDLFAADEVLLTNSIMQIMPVTRIEQHDVGDGCVGPLGRRLLNEYREMVRKECGGE